MIELAIYLLNSSSTALRSRLPSWWWPPESDAAGPTLWRQPDLAPHLRRADDFVARHGNRLAAELRAFRVGDPAADTRLSTMMRLAIALQYGMYGMYLIESAEG
jgi:hypothetical protein